MNKVILIGRVGKEISIRSSATGLEYVTFSLAVIDGYGDKKKTNWINCKAFGKTAENLNKYVNKGQQIAIEGKISTSSYEKDGKPIYTTDIIVNSFYFADSKKGDKQEAPEKAGTYIDVSDDDLPF